MDPLPKYHLCNGDFEPRKYTGGYKKYTLTGHVKNTETTRFEAMQKLYAFEVCAI